MCRHKSFWRGTKFSQIFGLAQKIWTGTKHGWHLVLLQFCAGTKTEFIKYKSSFGLAQNILIYTKHFWTWRRTRHMNIVLLIMLFAKAIEQTSDMSFIFSRTIWNRKDRTRYSRCHKQKSKVTGIVPRWTSHSACS